MNEDVPSLLRGIAAQLEEERAKFQTLRELVVIAAARVPDWAGANDEAHTWWSRAMKALEATA